MKRSRYSPVIRCYTHRLATGQKYITYSWDGDPRSPVLIGDDFWEDWNKLPWPLKFIDEDYIRGCRRYIRTDVAFWWVTDLRIQIGNRLEWVNQRILATLMIWELLYHTPYTVLRWCDLRLLRWLRSKLVKP